MTTTGRFRKQSLDCSYYDNLTGTSPLLQKGCGVPQRQKAPPRTTPVGQRKQNETMCWIGGQVIFTFVKRLFSIFLAMLNFNSGGRSLWRIFWFWIPRFVRDDHLMWWNLKHKKYSLMLAVQKELKTLPGPHVKHRLGIQAVVGSEP